MPYSRPTLTTVQARAFQDLQNAQILGISVIIPRSILWVLAWVIAGLAYEHYGYQDYIAENSTPWGATDEQAAAWGAFKGATRKDVSFASGYGVFPATFGQVVPAGTAITRPDGTAYVSTADAQPTVANTVTVPMQAVVGGAAGNITQAQVTAGVTLTLTSGVTGITGTGTASTPFTGGADQETEDAFKTRYLQLFSNPPQGGSATDYIEWAEAIPGVTRAWVNPLGMGYGTVVVYVMLDIAEASNNGFPVGTTGVAANDPRDVTATGDQLNIANAIRILQPVDALVYIAGPAPYPVGFNIQTEAATSASVQAAAATALQAVFLALADPLGGTLDLSPFESAIAGVAGMPKFTLTFPLQKIVAPMGSLPTLSTVTFTP